MQRPSSVARRTATGAARAPGMDAAPLASGRPPSGTRQLKHTEGRRARGAGRGTHIGTRACSRAVLLWGVYIVRGTGRCTGNLGQVGAVVPVGNAGRSMIVDRSPGGLRRVALIHYIRMAARVRCTMDDVSAALPLDSTIQHPRTTIGSAISEKRRARTALGGERRSDRDWHMRCVRSADMWGHMAVFGV